jgi:hypothetical protein
MPKLTQEEKEAKRHMWYLQYYDSNKEKIKARATEYNISHRERTNELWKLRYEALKKDPVAYEAYCVKRRESKARQYLKNRDKILTKYRESRPPKAPRKKAVIPEFEGPLDVKIIDKNPPRVFESNIKIFTGEFTMTLQ